MAVILLQTVLIIAVLILFVELRCKRIMKELSKIRKQLERLDNVTEFAANESAAEPVIEEEPAAAGPAESAEEKEEKDAETGEDASVEASAYNTGKSGKIYTKEELELLIKE